MHGGDSELLLIDDDPGMVRLITKLIEDALPDQVHVESLTDPREARSRLNQGGVDILLSDLEMPSVHGLELLRCAKRINARTQVIFVTGNSTQDALLDALELGASDYLLKPIERHELVEIVSQAHFRNRRWKDALAGTWRQQVAKTE